jgi:hypothetical protein
MALLCALMLVGVVVLSACGGTSSKTSSPVSDSTSVGLTTSTPMVPPAATAALVAYTGMWDAEEVAARTDDYQSPSLPAHASGAALSLLVRGLYDYRLQHLVIKGQLVLHPRVTSLTPSGDPTTAEVVDCADDSHWLVYKASGGLKDDIPGGHRRVTATVQYAAGAWKVTELNSGAEGTC